MRGTGPFAVRETVNVLAPESAGAKEWMPPAERVAFVIVQVAP